MGAAGSEKETLEQKHQRLKHEFGELIEEINRIKVKLSFFFVTGFISKEYNGLSYVDQVTSTRTFRYSEHVKKVYLFGDVSGLWSQICDVSCGSHYLRGSSVCPNCILSRTSEPFSGVGGILIFSRQGHFGTGFEEISVGHQGHGGILCETVGGNAFFGLLLLWAHIFQPWTQSNVSGDYGQRCCDFDK